VRSARLIAVGALVVGLAAVGLAAWQAAAPSCQAEAWNVNPSEDDLPIGWSIAATQFDLSRKTMSFVGPINEELGFQPQIISTVTCFEQGAAEAVTRSVQAAEDAQQSVIDRDDLGEQAFSAVDDSGATFLQLRKGRIVAYLAADGDTSSTDVYAVASAFDIALGGDGGQIIAPSDDLGAGSLDPGESFPEESPAAPDLVAMVPATVDGLDLEVVSFLGSTYLSENQGSRAILAALRAADREPDDLRVAEAYDALGTTDLNVLVVTVDGLPVAQTEALVMNVWLTATGAGVTREPFEMAGKSFTRVDYGDGGGMNYVLAEDDTVLVITTADADLAAAAAAALP
jgi:hypothetical protein